VVQDGWLQAQQQGQTNSVDWFWLGVPEGEAGVRQGSRGHANTQGSNDFINNELDSEDMSEQRASVACLPDSVPIESDEMAALNAVWDYEADPNVMLEDVPQDIVIKTLKVLCACVGV
jgi:hypothetical protein